MGELDDIVSAIKSAPNTEVISSADLPEAPQDFAAALAMRLEALVPRWPTTPTNPEFEPLIASLQEGAAELHALRQGSPAHRQRTYDEVEQRALAWRKTTGGLFVGQRAVLLAEADWLQVNYRASGIHGDFSPRPGEEDSFEGYLVLPSPRPFGSNVYGEVTLLNGLTRSGSETAGNFHQLTLWPLLQFEGDDHENPRPEDFKPLAAFTTQSEVELPEFTEADRQHWAV